MKNLNLDTRTLPVKSTNLRAVANDDGTTTVQGRAIVFNQPSQPLPFVEYISPHALDDVDFSKTLLLYGHDFNQILARADAGSLSVHIDNQGLTFKATLPDTTLAHDTRENINSGNVQGCSFGFKIADGGDYWDTADDGTALHYVTKIETVDELTLTPIPAYTQTSVQVQRSLDQILNKEDNTDMNSSNASSTTSSSATSSTATSSAALTASDVAAAITAAIKPLSSAVSSLVDRQCHNDSSDEDRAAKRDDGMDDVDESDDADLEVDDNETDDTRDSAVDSSDASSDADGDQGSSAASSAATSSAAVSDSTASSASSDSTRSLNPQNTKEDNTDMLDITPKKENQRSAFTKLILNQADAMYNGGFQHRDTVPVSAGDAGTVSLGTQGKFFLPENILQAYQEEHKAPRLNQFIHTENVDLPTGKVPYFDENTAVAISRKEFEEAGSFDMTDAKFVSYDVDALSAKIRFSREQIAAGRGGKTDLMAIAQHQMSAIQNNTDDKGVAGNLTKDAANKIASTDVIADLKTILNVNLLGDDSANANIVLTNSLFNELDQLKDNFGRPLLQPDPTQSSAKTLLGKPVVKVYDNLLGAKTGDKVAVVTPLNKSIYKFTLDKVQGQFIDNFSNFDVILGVFFMQDIVTVRPDLINVLTVSDKALAASQPKTVTTK